MRIKTHFFLTFMLLATLLQPWALISRAEAAPRVPLPPVVRSLPRPHLDYGIHVAPHTPTDMTWVSRLNMNWVKVYTYEQAEQFRDRYVLFRMDMGFPSDWNKFKGEIRIRTLELVSRGVEAVEVHNEPNLSLEWGNKPPNAWEYTQMLRVVYTEIKAVAPNMVVISGGLAPTDNTLDRMAVNDIDFAREMFKNGAGDYFDAFGYHPYGYNAAPEDAPGAKRWNFRRTELIRDLMVEYDLKSKPIWLTEFGWLRDPAEDGVNCSDNSPEFAGFAWLKVSGETQGDYIARAFDFADKNWEWAGPTFLWNLNWSMIPPQSLGKCSHMRWFAILKADGSATPALNRVAAMPRRPRQGINPIPEMEIVADDMTVEVGVGCLGVVEVGSFLVENAGFGGSFEATIEPATSFSGPPVSVSTDTAQPGDRIYVYADTTGLVPELYVVFINVRTTIQGERVVQNLRGFIVVKDGFAGCT
jgi:hypothetical protein